MDERITEEHESFAIIGIHRIHCGTPVEVFGSEIRSHDTVEITIRRAYRERNLNRYSYFGKEEIVRVEMTPIQFAEFITSANIGFGVPCSLRRLEGKLIPAKYGKGIGDVVHSEMKETFGQLSQDLVSIENAVKEILERPGPVKAADKKTLVGLIFKLVQDVKDNVPFMERQFKEAMASAVLESKGQIEAFAAQLMERTGLKKVLEDSGERMALPEIVGADDTIEAEAEKSEGGEEDEGA